MKYFITIIITVLITISMFASEDHDTILYFAYGSNMFDQRLKKRVPTAETLGKAKLMDYSLACTKVSKDGSSKLTIVKYTEPPYNIVYGVLYRINLKDKLALDKAEGLGNGYIEENIQVIFKGKTITAKTYMATRNNAHVRPYIWYKNFVLAGAKLHKFPIKYIQMIISALAKEDKNSKRRLNNNKILNNNLTENQSNILKRLFSSN